MCSAESSLHEFSCLFSAEGMGGPQKPDTPAWSGREDAILKVESRESVSGSDMQPSPSPFALLFSPRCCHSVQCSDAVSQDIDVNVCRGDAVL